MNSNVFSRKLKRPVRKHRKLSKSKSIMSRTISRNCRERMNMKQKLDRSNFKMLKIRPPHKKEEKKSESRSLKSGDMSME